MTETHTVPPTVLLTGFEPFGGDDTNPSGDIARALNGDTLTVDDPAHPGRGLTAHIVGRVLPVTFGSSATQLEQHVAEHQPQLIIALGLADGRDAITPERVAINYADARIPDNDGAQPRDAALDTNGPPARFTGLPVKRIARALSDAGHPATVSLTAGSYVCNALAYHLGAIAERHGRHGRHGRPAEAATPPTHTSLPAGVDTPLFGAPTPAGVTTPTTTAPIPAGFIHVPNWPADQLTPAIRLAIATTLANPTELDEAGGSIH